MRVVNQFFVLFTDLIFYGFTSFYPLLRNHRQHKKKAFKPTEKVPVALTFSCIFSYAQRTPQRLVTSALFPQSFSLYHFSSKSEYDDQQGSIKINLILFLRIDHRYQGFFIDSVGLTKMSPAILQMRDRKLYNDLKITSIHFFSPDFNML